MHVSRHVGLYSDRALAAMISTARSSSPRPSQQPSGRRRAGSYYDRTGVVEVIPNNTIAHFRRVDAAPSIREQARDRRLVCLMPAVQPGSGVCGFEKNG